jgi:EPTP domain
MATSSSENAGALLVEHQRLATSGARAVLTFRTGTDLYLAIAQLAVDIPGAPPHMNGGDSNVDMPLYRWLDGRFIADERLSVPGGEDALFFQIDGAELLATASIRTGSGPYDLNTDSVLYRRSGRQWEVFQRFPTFAAKQWHHFAIGARHFLALAQGVTIEGAVARNPRHSRIFEWNGQRFLDFQTLEGGWGYNWAHFEVEGRHFLGYADHTSPSILYTWNGESFAPFQELSPQGGRAFEFLQMDGQSWLAFANLTGESRLYRWHDGAFVPHQSLGGPGAREFAVVRTDNGTFLVKVNFIQGTPAQPKTDLTSCIYHWQQGQFVVAAEFPTQGATDATVFKADGQQYLAVSNSLSREVRFREDTVIYRLGL